MIIYYDGVDLLSQNHLFIAHGVNCQGKMASGVAKAIREKYPKAYEEYIEYWKKTVVSDGPNALLGRVNMVEVSEKTTVLNCFTQMYYGYDGKRYVSYDAIDDCFKKLCDILIKSITPIQAITRTEPYLAIPKIGSGLGGGDWNVIEAIINHRCKDIQVNVYSL